MQDRAGDGGAEGGTLGGTEVFREGAQGVGEGQDVQPTGDVVRFARIRFAGLQESSGATGGSRGRGNRSGVQQPEV